MGPADSTPFASPPRSTTSARSPCRPRSSPSPAELSEIEFILIKAHPTTGFDILARRSTSGSGGRDGAAAPRAPRRLGLPAGTQGDEILPEARILAVADVVEAMSSHRPYRPRSAWRRRWPRFANTPGSSSTRTSWRPASGWSRSRASSSRREAAAAAAASAKKLLNLQGICRPEQAPGAGGPSLRVESVAGDVLEQYVENLGRDSFADELVDAHHLGDVLGPGEHDEAPGGAQRSPRPPGPTPGPCPRR